MLRHQLSPEKWSTTQQVPKFSPPAPVTTFIFLLFHSNPYQNYLPPSFHFIRCTHQVPLKYRHAWVCFNLILGPLLNNICKSILQHSSCQTKMLMCVFVLFGGFFFLNSNVSQKEKSRIQRRSFWVKKYNEAPRDLELEIYLISHLTELGAIGQSPLLASNIK